MAPSSYGHFVRGTYRVFWRRCNKVTIRLCRQSIEKSGDLSDLWTTGQRITRITLVRSESLTGCRFSTRGRPGQEKDSGRCKVILVHDYLDIYKGRKGR